MTDETEHQNEQSVHERARAAGLIPTVAYVPEQKSAAGTAREKKAKAKREEREKRAAAGLRPLTIEAVPDAMREDLADAVRRMIKAGATRSESPAASTGQSELHAERPMWTALAGTLAAFVAGVIVGLLL